MKLHPLPTEFTVDANTIMQTLREYDEAQDVIERAAIAHANAVADIFEAHPNWEALAKHRLWSDPKRVRSHPARRYDTFEQAEYEPTTSSISCRFEDWDNDSFYVRFPVVVLHAFCEGDEETLAVAAEKVAQEYITVLTMRQVQTDVDKERKERAEFERLAAKYGQSA